MACSPCNLSTDDSITIDPSGLGTLCGDDAWTQCTLTMLRVWINDLAGTEFSDDRLIEVLKAASYFVYVELNCCANVSKPAVDPCNGCIGADPLQYPSFLTLTILKAACIVNQGRAQSKAQSEGLKAVCGPAQLQVSSSSAGINALLNSGPCESYAEMKRDLCFKCPMQSGFACKQILSTFVNSYFKPGLCHNSHANSDAYDNAECITNPNHNLQEGTGGGGCCGGAGGLGGSVTNINNTTIINNNASGTVQQNPFWVDDCG